MQVLVAPDAFKGSATAFEAATAMQQGVLRVFPHASVLKCPIADGGEGTVDSLVYATHGSFETTQVTGPLGEMVEARWGILGDGITAVIEMAASSGLGLVPPEKRNPAITTTYGTGELILAALDKGIRTIILGIGGSATNDGGVGCISALGARFLDASGSPLPFGGQALADLASIDLQGLDSRLKETAITIASDVSAPLCGQQGATHIFGPQKGATPAMVQELDKALAHYAALATQTTGRNSAAIKGSGAAGGLGAGLLYFTNANLELGIDLILRTLDFAFLIEDCQFIITGEGMTDRQTTLGKAPIGVAKVAEKLGIPVLCVSGSLGKGYESIYSHGISAATSCVQRPMSLDESMANAPDLIARATERICKAIAIGMRIEEK